MRRCSTRRWPSVVCPPAAAASPPPVRSPRRWPRSTKAGSGPRSGRRTRRLLEKTQPRRADRTMGTDVGQLDQMWRYDGKRVVVTGCASGIGAHVARQLAELGARVTGLDVRPPAVPINEFISVDLADAESIDHAVASIGGPVDALFNVAGVSSGIGKPLLVVIINFLGMRYFTESLIPNMAPGSSVSCVSSLAASGYRENAAATAGLLQTST